MNKTLKWIAILAGWGVLATASGCSPMYRAMGYPPNPMRTAPPPGVLGGALAVGARLPAATLSDDAGKPFALADRTTDKAWVLVFYRGHWCPYCRAQLSEMQSLLADFTKAGVGVAAIAGEGAEDSAPLRQKLGLTLDLWTDQELALTKAMGIADTENAVPWPAVFVVDKGGVVRWRWVAETYKVRPSAKDVLAQVPRP
ncbi:MAG: AhpC/TSA family protein [Deltaproteobacteria bacterium]|nr:AhpC/TSA family protein [Deltaproteobacteria bacterium]